MKVFISENDLWQAYLVHYKSYKSRFFWMAILGIVVAVGMYTYTVLPIGLVLSGFLGAVLGVLAYIFIFVRYYSKKIYRQQANLHIPYELTWDESAIHMENQYGHSSMPWETFIKVIESEQLILLYYSDVLFNIVSKNAFESEEKLSDFRSHLSKIYDKK